MYYVFAGNPLGNVSSPLDKISETPFAVPASNHSQTHQQIQKIIVDCLCGICIAHADNGFANLEHIRIFDLFNVGLHPFLNGKASVYFDIPNVHQAIE